MSNNQYFSLAVDSDKFENKSQTSTEIPYYADDGLWQEEKWTLSYRHYSTEEREELLIDLELHNLEEEVRPYEGKLYFLINGVQRIALDAHGRYHPEMEYAFYILNQDILKQICEAKTLEIKIEGRFGSKIVPFDHKENDSSYPTNDAITGEGFILFSQCFYNEFYGSLEYPEALNNYIKYEDARKASFTKLRSEMEKRIRRTEGRSSSNSGKVIAIIIILAFIAFLIYGALV